VRQGRSHTHVHADKAESLLLSLCHTNKPVSQVGVPAGRPLIKYTSVKRKDPNFQQLSHVKGRGTHGHSDSWTLGKAQKTGHHTYRKGKWRDARAAVEAVSGIPC